MADGTLESSYQPTNPAETSQGQNWFSSPGSSEAGPSLNRRAFEADLACCAPEAAPVLKCEGTLCPALWSKRFRGEKHHNDTTRRC